MGSLLSLLEQYKAWSPINALYVPICSALLGVNDLVAVVAEEQSC